MNDFKIISKLGEGAYSTVYKVKRIVDNNIYALKKVKLLNLSEKEKQNSLNEVRLLASIKSNFVISYKEAFFDEKDSTLGIVMEFADRGDLYQKIVEHKKSAKFFEETDIWRIFIQLVKGLKALHDLKILHRDLKSANVFLLSDGTAKLGDLNVSKVAKKGLGYTQTGTPYYASPEVWKDQPYDNKSDIWSLGCVLYEMITLRPPFRAQNMEGLYNKVIKGQFNKIPDRFSNELFEIVKLLLQINTESRPSCDEILKHQIIQKRIEYFKSFAGDSQNEDKALLQTIRIPKNLLFLSDKLPKPNYSKHLRSNGVNDKVILKSYKSFSKKPDLELKKINENFDSIKNPKNNNDNVNKNSISNSSSDILPKVKFSEPKINKKSIEFESKNNNMEIIHKNLPHSGSQKILIYKGNKKYLNNKIPYNVNINNVSNIRKNIHNNIGANLPSIKVLNPRNKNINHINELYKIYAPYINKQHIKNNLKYKVYNNNNNNYYVKNLHRYEFDRRILNNIKNYYKNNNSFQLQMSRINSGKKVKPHGKLSPIRRNLVNIC